VAPFVGLGYGAGACVFFIYDRRFGISTLASGRLRNSS